MSYPSLHVVSTWRRWHVGAAGGNQACLLCLLDSLYHLLEVHCLLPQLTCCYLHAGGGMLGPPVEIRRAALASMQRLLPGMHLSGYASSILHPLIRVLDTSPELRYNALETIASLAVALGPDFAIFAPTVRKVS